MLGEGDSNTYLNDVKQIYEKNELTKPVVPPKPKLAPKPRSIRQTALTANSVHQEGAVPKLHTYPKTAGSYHFDGTYFLPLKPDDSQQSSEIQDVYKPGSDFVEVTGAPGAKLTYRCFNESSNVEEQIRSQDSVTADYRISRDFDDYKTLQIVLNLNLSDLKNNDTTQRNRPQDNITKEVAIQTEVYSTEFSKGDINNEEKKSTNLKRQEQSSPQKRGKTNLNYEDIDESTITFREEVQNPKEQERPRSGPPEIPPRIRKNISIKTEKSSVKSETGNSSSEDEFGYQKFVQEEKQTTTSFTEKLESSIFNNEDISIRQEVDITKSQPWFFMYSEKKTAKIILESKWDKPGSFIVVCERTHQHSVNPFTLWVMKNRKIIKVQIRKQTESGKSKFKIPEEKRSFKHITDLIDHYTKQKLPFMDTKLHEWPLPGAQVNIQQGFPLETTLPSATSVSLNTHL